MTVRFLALQTVGSNQRNSICDRNEDSFSGDGFALWAVRKNAESKLEISVCNWSGPDRSHGPKIRTGPKFGTGPRTGPSELPKVQYIFSVLKINIANLAAFVVKDMCSKFSNYR